MSLAVTTDTVETARVRHDLWPVATAALGRAMTELFYWLVILKTMKT